MVLGNGTRIEFFFQGFGLSPDFVALGVRGLLRSLRSGLAFLPSAQCVAQALLAYLDDITGIVPPVAVLGSPEKTPGARTRDWPPLRRFSQELLLRALVFLR